MEFSPENAERVDAKRPTVDKHNIVAKKRSVFFLFFLSYFHLSTSSLYFFNSFLLCQCLPLYAFFHYFAYSLSIISIYFLSTSFSPLIFSFCYRPLTRLLSILFSTITYVFLYLTLFRKTNSIGIPFLVFFLFISFFLATFHSFPFLFCCAYVYPISLLTFAYIIHFPV